MYTYSTQRKLNGISNLWEAIDILHILKSEPQPSIRSDAGVPALRLVVPNRRNPLRHPLPSPISLCYPPLVPRPHLFSLRRPLQGVFYGDCTVRDATELGLKGWVRNRIDGSLEHCFPGTLMQLKRWSRGVAVVLHPQ
ncbi:unnamed protein product [Malus baccata var. baccata]